MSIISFLQFETTILGITDKGQLILWDLKQNKSPNGTFIFQNNISIIPSKLKFNIDNNNLLQMHSLGKIIVMNNHQTIYITNLQQIYKSTANNIDGIVKISMSSYLEKKQHINCTLVIDQQNILMGTNRGNLIMFNLNQNNVIKKVNLEDTTNSSQNQDLSYMPSIKRITQITSISYHFSNDLILIGSSNGKLYTFSLHLYSFINEFQLKDKQQLQQISKIIVSKQLDRIYCLHDNYITQWNTKINSCISYIQYTNPKDMMTMNQDLYIVGNTSKLIWLYDNNINQIDLSMRCGKFIRQIGDKMIAVGGSQGCIDVFISGIRLMTLFTN